jgi:hypothetical protein
MIGKFVMNAVFVLYADDRGLTPPGLAWLDCLPLNVTR